MIGSKSGRIRRRLAILGAALAASLASVAVSTAPQAGAAAQACAVTYQVNQWTGGFTAQIGLTNEGPALNGWTLTWSFDGNQHVTSAWNAQITQSGTAVTAKNMSYNASVATGATTTLGFQGTFTGSNDTPSDFAVNGVACNAPASSTAGDWPTYHLDNTRAGYQPNLSPVSSPALQWTAPLDGAVYGQPLIVGNRVLAATENDTVYALDRTTGSVLWSAHVGDPEPLSDLPCGDISPLGITSTMVYDPATNRVYTLAETAGAHHTLMGINVATGAVEVRAAAEPTQGDPAAHQQRGALTLMNGRVYIPYGGMFGDCADYIGQVVSLATDGTGLQDYAVPTTREAGIWAPAGGVQDGSSLLYSVGNGAANTSTSAYDGSDSVIRLSPSLQRTDFFAPSNWAQQNAADEDLSSMAPALVNGYVYADGKSGTGYVLTPGNLGGIGGQVAELNDNCQAFGGSAVVGSTVYLPCSTGPRAVTVAANGTPSELWKSTVPAAGSPVVGGGAVWTVDYNGGDLYALDPATGATLAKVHIGQAPSFTSPSLSGNQVFVGTTTGVAAVNGA